MRDYTVYKSEAEWMADRKNGFGGSEVGTLAGYNPYSTRFECIKRKIESRKGIGEDISSNAMRWGHLLEGVVADEVLNIREDDTAVFRKTPNGGWDDDGQVSFYGECDWERATPDRLVTTNDGDAILEIKTTALSLTKDDDKHVYFDAICEGKVQGIFIPKTWALQVQWEMYCADIHDGYIAILQLQTRRLLIAYVKYDADIVKRLRGIVADAWQNVLNEELPEPTNGDEAAIVYPESNGSVVESTDQTLLDVYEKLTEIKARMKDDEAAAKELEGQLKVAIGEADTLSCLGKTLCTWKSRTSSRLDTKRLQLEAPDVYDKYIKQSSSRTFLLK